MIQITIHTLQSDSITIKEQDLGHFTCHKLKKLLTWIEQRKENTNRWICSMINYFWRFNRPNYAPQDQCNITSLLELNCQAI